MSTQNMDEYIIWLKWILFFGTGLKRIMKRLLCSYFNNRGALFINNIYIYIKGGYHSIKNVFKNGKHARKLQYCRGVGPYLGVMCKLNAIAYSINYHFRCSTYLLTKSTWHRSPSKLWRGIAWPLITFFCAAWSLISLTLCSHSEPNT